MYGSVKDEIAATLKEIEDAGLYKNERELTSPQSSHTISGDPPLSAATKIGILPLLLNEYATFVPSGLMDGMSSSGVAVSCVS